MGAESSLTPNSAPGRALCGSLAAEPRENGAMEVPDALRASEGRSSDSGSTGRPRSPSDGIGGAEKTPTPPPMAPDAPVSAEQPPSAAQDGQAPTGPAEARQWLIVPDGCRPIPVRLSDAGQARLQRGETIAVARADYADSRAALTAALNRADQP